MKLKINDHAIAIGEGTRPEVLAAAGFRRRSLLSRLVKKEPRGAMVFEAENCTVTCFGDDFELYPCNHSYLTPDRRWRTAASVIVVNDRVASAMLKIIDAKYAASEFVSRFREVCTGNLGEPHQTDSYIVRWRNGRTRVTSLLKPDTKNASFLFETASGS